MAVHLTAPRRQAVLLIVDGLGDLPSDELGGLTPLEAAHTPNLDRLASRGWCGLVDPVFPGEIPHTDSGVGLLMGLAPGQVGMLHRGPVEAAGAGRPLRAGEVALRGNFATLEERAEGLWLTDRRAGRISERVGELAAQLSNIDLGDGILAEFLPTDQHRGVLVLGGEGLDPAVSDTDPGDAGSPGLIEPCRALEPGAILTADKVNRFLREAHLRLRDHGVNQDRVAAGKPPATGIITRGAGAGFQPDNELAGRGLRVAVVAGCNTVLGLARMFGFATVESDAFTAALDTDLDGKVAAALGALPEHDLVYIHVKGADLCAHDRQPVRKRDFLERLDQALEPLTRAEIVIGLSADHTTDSNTGAHTADPVPSLLFDPEAPAPAAITPLHFGEAACRTHSGPALRSHELLGRVLEMLGA